MDTKLQLINHSSLLIKKGSKYLFLDPWHLRPAFGSWMPTFQQYIHPSYLSALGENLSIVISHGHDDHFDDDLLKIFDKETEFIFTKFKSPSVLNRLKRLGFQNTIEINPNSNDILKLHDGSFKLKSYINTVLSDDDSIITISTDCGVVIHANDNWIPFSDDTANSIMTEINKTRTRKGYLFTQTNSASGYPLTYPYLDDQSEEVLRKKVIKMIEGGMANARKVGLDRIFSYAGYATPFVKGENYNKTSLFPTPRFISNQLFEKNNSNINIENLYPGDTLNISNGIIDKAFVSSEDYSDDQIKNSTENYYSQYKHMPSDYFPVEESSQLKKDEVDWFMYELNKFVSRKIVENPKWNSINAKIFAIEIEDLGVSCFIQFGNLQNFVGDFKQRPNKKCLIKNSSIFKSILNGKTLFESLYTGYLAKWERYPPEIYNQDIITMITMFSYFYKNLLVKDYKIKFKKNELIV